MFKILRNTLRRARDDHQEHEAHCMSLCCARSGQTVCVSQLVGECGEAACLRDLGLCEGANVTVLRHGETLLVRTGDARFGIGRRAAQNVMCDLVAHDSVARDSVARDSVARDSVARDSVDA